MVFLCQPNNPTGQLTPLPLVERILRRCEACGALLVVDECFLDFLPDCDTLTAKALLDSKNLLILKAFTKLYGMAGVRLGYCLCSEHGPAGSHAGRRAAVGGVQSGAGRRALLHWTKRTMWRQVRALIAQQRPGCTAGLRALGLRVTRRPSKLPAVPAAGNAGRCPAPQGRGAAQLQQLPGLDSSWYRTAVRTGPEND